MRVNSMATIIFDIETVPVDFDSLDAISREYLLKFADRKEEQEKVKEQMALWAPTNTIVAIGMLAVESQKGAVYFQSGETKIDTWEENGIKYETGSEKDILEKFWNAIAHAHQFVTFNGRCFDCPVLLLRSAILSVKPSKNIMPYRYSTENHVDLLEQLTFYGAVRKFNLDFFCKSFGIASPKGNGITGHDVLPLFQKGAYTDIARYCAGDLFATRTLYLRWKEYLSS